VNPRTVNPRTEILREIPDTPRFVDTRAMLQSPHATVLGGASVDEGFVVRLVHGAQSVLAGVGRPAREAVLSAIDGITAMTPFIAQVDNADYLEAVLRDAVSRPGDPAWRRERVILFLLTTMPALAPLDASVSIRLATKQDALDHLPSGLRFEIAHALDLAPVGAAFVDGRAAAFCYPCWTTESLWDLSIDTLPEYRQRGLAAQAVRFMIEHLRPSGRQPVWGALESNHASLRLAERLGFRPIEENVAFSRGPWAYLTNGYVADAV
jgi:RimJ/RimL family protein N-acetyltransferase